jgi:hypothetical protein
MTSPAESTFCEAITALVCVAGEAGLDSTRRALWLMTSALALADVNIPGGTTEEQFVSMARATYAKLRHSLTTGAIS